MLLVRFGKRYELKRMLIEAMKLRTKKITLILLSLSCVLSSCEKEEGFGGNSDITGKVVKKIYNNDYSLLLEEEPAKDEDVFLSFGSGSVINEKTETSFTGEFTFEYLFEGEYTVFYYSKDFQNSAQDKIEMVRNITLKKGETVSLDDLVVYDTYDFDEGEATIEGKVMVKNYYNSTTWPNLIVKDITPAQEQEIYLVYGNHKQFDQRIRTNYDGTFVFTNLIKGNYKIYVYSEDVKGGTADIVIQKEVQITNKQQEHTLEEITIEKL